MELTRFFPVFSRKNSMAGSSTLQQPTKDANLVIPSREHVIKTLIIDELNTSIDFLNQIVNLELDVLHVKNAIPSTTAHQWADTFLKYDGPYQTTTSFGKIIIERLHERAKDNFRGMNVEAYLSENELVNTSFSQLLKVPLGPFFCELTSRLSSNKTVSIAHAPWGDPFIPVSAKIMETGQKEIPVHTGIQFIGRLLDMIMLEQNVDLRNQLSFLTLLHKPEKGGELYLLDLEWSDVPEDVRNSPDKLNEFLSSRNKTIVPMETGDLVFFAGGRIWHGVTSVSGNQPRVTIGGFAARLNATGNYLIWS